jgi:hypothetical protein
MEGRGGMSAPAAPEPSSSTRYGRAAERPGTVKKPLTASRTRPVVENPEYAAFARRILKACARCIAAGDIESLALMAELADTIDSSIGDAVTGLREQGYSWAEIGSGLGVTRQAAQQRWELGRDSVAGHARGVSDRTVISGDSHQATEQRWGTVSRLRLRLRGRQDHAYSAHNHDARGRPASRQRPSNLSEGLATVLP